MSSLFEDLKEGLEEAIAYEKGYGAGRVKTYMILPVKEYSGKEIRDIRTKAGMTQSVFASLTLKEEFRHLRMSLKKRWKRAIWSIILHWNISQK